MKNSGIPGGRGLCPGRDCYLVGLDLEGTPVKHTELYSVAADGEMGMTMGRQCTKEVTCPGPLNEVEARPGPEHRSPESSASVFFLTPKLPQLKYKILWMSVYSC